MGEAQSLARQIMPVMCIVLSITGGLTKNGFFVFTVF
jgi:hypothetical protein